MFHTLLGIVQGLPLWLQLMIWLSWLGLGAMVPIAYIKALNTWPTFFAVYLVILICLVPHLLLF